MDLNGRNAILPKKTFYGANHVENLGN